MADPRKPHVKLLLQINSNDTPKKLKIELFSSELWDDGKRHNFQVRKSARRYRVRINGKWFDKKKGVNLKYFTSWEFRDILWRSIGL